MYGRNETEGRRLASDMWIQNLLHHQVFSVPLWVILLCGLVGILVDIDHPISYYWLTNLGRQFLHTPLLIGSCIVLCCCGACVGGLLIRMVLS